MNTLLIKRTFISTLALTLSLLIIIFSAEAQNNESKNQNLTVKIDTNNCVTAVVPASTGPSNCELDYPAEKNPCKGKSECICMKKEKNVIWTADKANKIEIKFSNDSPFNQQCTLKSTSNKIDCKIKNAGTFDYEVHAEGCASKPYDPRIVVQ